MWPRSDENRVESGRGTCTRVGELPDRRRSSTRARAGLRALFLRAAACEGTPPSFLLGCWERSRHSAGRRSSGGHREAVPARSARKSGRKQRAESRRASLWRVRVRGRGNRARQYALDQPFEVPQRGFERLVELPAIGAERRFNGCNCGSVSGMCVIDDFPAGYGERQRGTGQAILTKREA